MFGHDNFAKVRANFSRQFASHGSDLVYRKSQIGAPVRVSVAERDAFVAAFDRFLRVAYWSIILGTMLVLGGGEAIMIASGSDSRSIDMEVYGGFAVVVLLFGLAYRRAWNAPGRALERRPVMGDALSGEEARRQALAQLSYGQLAIGAAGGVFAIAMLSIADNLSVGWYRLWLVLLTALVGVIAVQALRKWRMGAADARDEPFDRR